MVDLFFCFAGQAWQSHCPGTQFSWPLAEAPESVFRSFSALFHLYQDGNLINKPDINLCDIMDLFVREMPRRSASAITQIRRSSTICSCFLSSLFIQKAGKVIGHQAVHMLLQRTDRLHQASLKVVADTHHLTGSFHLSGQRHALH